MQSLAAPEFPSTWHHQMNDRDSGFSPRIERKMPRQDFESQENVPEQQPRLPVRVRNIIDEAHCVFTGVHGPALEQINLTPLREKLAALRPEDVAGDKLGMLSRGEIGYISIEENPMFTVGVFFLAPGAKIPLHDHPEMCVLSQVVKGRVHVTSFDFDLSSANDMAYLVDDSMYSAPTTRTLYPTSGGNLHQFATRTGCIIVDVMSPPYDETDGRECTYFRASRIDNQIYKMEKIPQPENFEVLDLSQ